MSSRAGLPVAELPLSARLAGRGSGVHVRRIAAAGAGVWLLSGAGALIGHLAPSLVSGNGPHAMLHGTLGELTSVLANNLRVLCAPFLLALLRWPRGQLTRRLGDILIAGLIVANTIAVGLALGHYGSALAPYVRQLPLEWSALALAGAAWLWARDGASPRVLALYALSTLALSIGAGAVEVLLSPHARMVAVAQSRSLTLPSDPSPLAGSGCRLPASSFAPGRASLQGRCAPFPSLRSVPLAAFAGALRTTSTTRSPQGGTT